MPALGFQKQFVEAVENGLDLIAGRPLRHPGVQPKIQTIRALRKRPFANDDRLFLYYGLRTKQCRKIGEATATAVHHIEIEAGIGRAVFVDREILPIRKIQELAKANGFADARSMVDWFEKTHGPHFEGQLIQWGE